MKPKVLLTSAEEDSEKITEALAGKEVELLHFPLERYIPAEGPEAPKIISGLEAFENVVFSNKKNAAFFIERVKALGKLAPLKKRLNLAADESTAAFLEEQGIAAVCTYAENKSINMVEFMLRLRRLGATLYPCGSHKKEEIPGFLEELDIPVTELVLYELKGPAKEKLASWKEELHKRPPDVVIFHSRRSVSRTLAAFPALNYEGMELVTADTAITNKLEQQHLHAQKEANGSWESIAELLL